MTIKETLKERVLYLLHYTDALLKKMTSESERINNNVNVMIEMVHKDKDIDSMLDDYKCDRIYYNLYEGEITKSYSRLVELYKLAKEQKVVFSEGDTKRLELLVQQEEDGQFFSFKDNEIVPKNEEVVKLMKKHISEQDGEAFKEQFIKDIKENFNKVKQQATQVGHTYKTEDLEYKPLEEEPGPVVEDIDFEEIEEVTEKR